MFAFFRVSGAAMFIALGLLFAPALADTGDVGGGEPPVADAGVGLLAYEGDTVSLNGSASSDPEGAKITYAWAQSGGPEVELEKATTAEPQFTIPAPGTFRFDLVVSDGAQESAPDTVEIVAPEKSFSGEAESGCASAGGAPAALLAAGAWALVAGRRSPRRRA